MSERKGFKDFLRTADKWIMPPKASVLEKTAIFGSDLVAIAGTITTFWYINEPIWALATGFMAAHSAVGGALVRVYANYREYLS